VASAESDESGGIKVAAPKSPAPAPPLVLISRGYASEPDVYIIT